MSHTTTPELVVFGIRIGLLVLLWLFVVLAVRVMRSDLRAGSAPRQAPVRPVAAPARAAAPAKAPKRGRNNRPGRLVVTAGGLAGTSITLNDQPVTIGRADDSTLVLTDDYASARHARLVLRNDGLWYVEDLGSTNGTYLDRQKVTAPTPVPVGVPIRIGKTALELRR